jgi:hypothetical protein
MKEEKFKVEIKKISIKPIKARVKITYKFYGEKGTSGQHTLDEEVNL